MHDSYKNLLSIQSEIKKEFDNINNKSINPEIKPPPPTEETI